MKDENLAKSLERRRMEASFLRADVLKPVPELVVHERMSQVEEVRSTKEKKKVKGWSGMEICTQKQKV